MKKPLAILAAVLWAVATSGAIVPAHADLSLFGDYYENVARAARQNDAALVMRLLASGVNPNQVDEDSRTALQYAAMNGNLQIIALLVKAKVRLDLKDKLGNTALMLAVDRGQVDAAKLLLDVGAPVDAENKNGMTALMIAANRGDLDSARALLAKGASPTKTDYTGRDAAGWAAESHRPAVLQAIRQAQQHTRR
jgi:ankyrin repeat protein